MGDEFEEAAEFARRLQAEAAGEEMNWDEELEDDFTVSEVTPGLLRLAAYLSNRELMLAVSKETSACCRVGLGIGMRLGRSGDEWRVIGVGYVYPPESEE